MVKALLRYYYSDKKKVVTKLMLHNVMIKQMYDGVDSVHPKIICVFDDIEHMNQTLYDINCDIYDGVDLVRYRKVFDFWQWWNGKK